MTTWWHHPTILNLRFDRRLALRISCILLLCIALITTLFISAVAQAAPGINQTIGFQGRLLDVNGDIVPNGYYNMQFKIYQDGTGTVAGNPSGTLKWTETYINNGSATGAVEVKNGFMSVNLGTLNPFGTSVDWNQDTLWLSMNIAGSSTTCTTFGTSPCVADGEMLPMKRMTATPYAINSGSVGGKTANNLVQLGQGAQTDAGTASSIYINKTGTGNLIQLQAASTDAFTVNNAGNVVLGSAANQSIRVGPATSGAGKNLSITAGSAAGSTSLGGGDLILRAGVGDGTGQSGNVIVKANGTESSGVFKVQNIAGTTLFNVNSINNTVSAGTINLLPTAATAGVNSSLWTAGTTPAVVDTGDTGGLEAGTKFRASVSGNITGVRFYKSTLNTGTHIGNLWNSSGANLASVVFTGESASGWQQATFSSPVHIEANTTYIISYFAPAGHYSSNSGYFTSSAFTNGPLTALRSGTDGGNGMYKYAAASTFPSDTSPGNDNGWVDVVFQADADDKISSTNNLLVTSSGSMTLGPVDKTLRLQGSTINIGATSGGNVTVQGGSATTNNGNGGNVTIAGGTGSGTGASGLVILGTPTFSTTTNDINCYTNGSVVSGNCTVATSSVNNSAAVIVGFSTTGRTATLPDPTITTAGRILYVSAAAASKDFTLSINGGANGNRPTIRPNTTATLLWNGSDWTVASATNYGVNTTNNIENIQIGSGSSDGTTTLLTIDKATSAPSVTDSALLGSMYYDTTSGKVNCYEADGWGACGSSPDVFVTLSPEYANSVQNGTGTGTMTSDFCSDALNINDGSSSQPTICGTNETYNHYRWTAASTSAAQVKSIYVTYQLPSSFNNFVAGSTSLMGRTDNTFAIVDYQTYKNTTAGLTACGSAVAVSTGAQTLWQKGIATSTADPANCTFTAGDSVVFKVNLSARNSFNAYAGNLSFAFSSK